MRKTAARRARFTATALAVACAVASPGCFVTLVGAGADGAPGDAVASDSAVDAMRDAGRDVSGVDTPAVADVPGDAAVPGLDVSMDAGPPPTIYVTTASTLYTFTPPSALTQVAAYTGVPAADGGAAPTGVLDLAASSDGRLWATAGGTDGSNVALYEVNPVTAALTRVAPFTGATTVIVSMAFVAAGVLDPVDEIMVGGGTGTDIFKINIGTGATTTIGTVSGATIVADMVGVGNRTVYLVSQNSLGGSNELFELHFVPSFTSTLLGSFGATTSAAGLAYRSPSAYAFTFQGTVDAVNPASVATAQSTTPLGAAMFFGAAVAPSVAP